jgi:hypothetical protein
MVGIKKKLVQNKKKKIEGKKTGKYEGKSGKKIIKTSNVINKNLFEDICKELRSNMNCLRQDISNG